MARLSKRKKIKPEITRELKKPMTKRTELWIVSFIVINIVLLFIGYQRMDMPSLVMYTLLVLALISIYIKRKFPIPEHIERHLDMFGLASISIAFFFFLYVCYEKFTA